ncbi:MAG: hypothetical protein K6B65_00610 [Bacilli bacterium]|nr:hypothetical protein [Bacilli bacterium]
MAKDEKKIVQHILDLYEKGEDEEAYAIAKKYRDEIFEVEPELAISITIDLALRLSKIREAEEALRYFEEKPYVRQQVEEALKDARADIDNEIESLEDKNKKGGKKKAFPAYSPSLTDDEVSLFLGRRNKKGKEALDFARALLLDSSRDDLLRTGGLLTLIDMGSDEIVSFRKNGEDFKVNPAKMKGPGEYPFFESVFKELGKKRFSEYGEYPKKVLFQLEVTLFPVKLNVIAPKDILIEALFYTCEALFQKPIDFSSEEEKEAFMRIYELLFHKSYNPSGNLASA